MVKISTPLDLKYGSNFSPNWPILIISMANIMLSRLNWNIDDHNGPGIDYKGANGNIPMKTKNEENSTLFDLKNGHNFSLSWPILMIFVANIILSHVLIDIMMTRMVQA